jgi:hypothetical protein
MEDLVSLTFSICVLGQRDQFLVLKSVLEKRPIDWNDYGILHAYCACGSISDLQGMFDLYPNTILHVDADLPFKLAVMYNSLEVVQYLMNYGPFEVLDTWLSTDNEFGHSLNVLVCALKNGNLELVKYLLDQYPVLNKSEYVVEGIRFWFNNETLKKFLNERFSDLPVVDWSPEDISDVSEIMDRIEGDTKKIMEKYY